MNQNKKFQASVIVSTYNQEKYLAMVLAGLTLQTFKDFEVCIADDGSREPTKIIIDNYSNKLNIQHFWQEDKGFRKSKILNQAIKNAKSDYIIFLDGDCVPHARFVEMHLKYKEKGKYLAGRRIEVSRKLSEKFNEEDVLNGKFNRINFDFIWDSLRGKTEYYHRYIVNQNKFLRKICGLDKIADAKGCNFSVSKDALIAINGYDEDYEGYGREDTDLEVRLQYYGLKIKSVKSLSVQYHLWHERRAFVEANDVRLDDLKTQSEYRSKNGIEKL